MTHLEILDYAATLSQAELAALVSDLLDLQGRIEARRATAQQTTVLHEAGAV